MKKLATLIVLGSILAGGVFFGASQASALSVEEMQTQIKELLAKVSTLTQQIQGQSSSTAFTVPTVSQLVQLEDRFCRQWNRNLSIGARGDDVTQLQTFLQSEGYLNAQASGYFGQLTADALKRWQAQNGIDSVGSLGPKTRDFISRRCGGGTMSNILTAAPQTGSAPLAVTFTVRQRLTNPNLIADAGNYKVVFGDGAEYVLPCTDSSGSCKGPHTVPHTYSSNGTYTASLVHYGYFGPADGGNQQTVASLTITVGSNPVACTMEYAPVCGQKQVQCIKAPCNPVQQTYGNKCTMAADGATLLYTGECRTSTTNPADDPQCKAWYDGCNNCSRQTPGGPMVCTQRACFQQAQAYCSVYFSGTGNSKPVISGFSGPTTLAVNQTGTWTVNASDPDNDQLTYSVVWGDEWSGNTMTTLNAAGSSVIQNSTLTHSYSQPGSYRVQITVGDTQGNSAQMSTTVQVQQNSTACTREYAPVCARPTGCANTCAPGMACPAICKLYEPQTYSNQCLATAASATFLHTGVCTGNELPY